MGFASAPAGGSHPSLPKASSMCQSLPMARHPQPAAHLRRTEALWDQQAGTAAETDPERPPCSGPAVTTHCFKLSALTVRGWGPRVCAYFPQQGLTP